MTIFTIVVVLGLIGIWGSELYSKRKEDQLRDEYVEHMVNAEKANRLLDKYQENIKIMATPRIFVESNRHNPDTLANHNGMQVHVFKPMIKEDE